MKAQGIIDSNISSVVVELYSINSEFCRELDKEKNMKLIQ